MTPVTLNKTINQTILMRKNEMYRYITSELGF